MINILTNSISQYGEASVLVIVNIIGMTFVKQKLEIEMASYP